MTTTKNQNTSKPHRIGRGGFGLVELVVMIALLGVLSAIAIPAMAGISDQANVRRCQRIAQDYSILANSAISAGNVDLIAAGTVAEVIELISTGVYGSDVFSDTIFQLPGVSMADRTKAAHHLTIEHGGVTFDPDNSKCSR